jgi:ketosteroid isomerase-like protein
MTHQSMPREQALSLVRQLLDAAFRHDYEGVASFYAADAVAVSPVFGEVKGRDAVGATWQTLFTMFSDLAIENVDYLVDGNRVAVLGKICTTDRFGWFGQAPTGSPITYSLVLLFTVIDGLIVHDERIYDSAGIVERLEKARLDKEMRTASDVQQALLPRTAHIGRFYESVGDSIPCRAIGGDFFELTELPSGDVGIVMGDIAGKGPAAALLAALLQGMFAVEAPAGGSPALTLTRINRRLAARGIEPRFATLVYGVLSPDGRFTYSNAGHNPPVLAGRSGVRRLTTGGPILGAFADAAFEEETLQLHPLDTLVMFTDGVTEARNPGDEEFGDDRLIERIVANAACRPLELMKSVFEAVDGFCQGTDQGDDITVTVSRFNGSPRSTS